MSSTSKLVLFLKALVLAAALLGVAGCAVVDPTRVVKTGNVQPATLQRMEALHIDRGAPVLVRVFKEENTLEVWKQDRRGRFIPLKSYAICRYSGMLGPKKTEGDHQAPEGFYDITFAQMNPFSHEYLSFNTGFPNAFDQSLGRTGSFLMVHGGCRSVGCYAMTDESMDEIYGLLYEAFQAGQEKVQLQAFPFRMTAQNLALHDSDPNASFWRMLKRGSDAFDLASAPPSVGVCGRQYVFNVDAKSLDPLAPCPPGVAPVEMADSMAQPQPLPQPMPLALQSRPLSYQRSDPISRAIGEDFRAIHD